MANVLLNSEIITKELLLQMDNHLVMAKSVNKSYSSKFGTSSGKVGVSINLRKPQRYVGRTGKNMAVEDTVETTHTLSITTLFGVDLDFDDVDLALKIEDFSDRYIKPAVAEIANKVDEDLHNLHKRVYNFAGSASRSANELEDYLDAGAILDACGVPRDGSRSVIVDEWTQAKLVSNLKGLFNSASQIGDQYEKGVMGQTGGFTFKMSQNTSSHTFGTGVNDPILVKGANQSGATLLVDGLAGKLNAGDSFTIPGVYSINKRTRKSTGKLQQFVVLEDANTASQNTLKIAPEIVGPGAGGALVANQTVTALPADNAALSFVGTAGETVRVGLAFHKDAFALVTADLMLPNGTDMAGRASDEQAGLSIRMIRDYIIGSNDRVTRLDIFYGVDVIYPEWVVKVFSKI